MSSLIKKIASVILSIGVLATTILSGGVFVSAESTTYQISELTGKYKTQGRTAFVEDCLMLDWSASGIEFNANCSGDVSVTVNATQLGTSDTGGLYFSVFVDGEMMYEDMRIPDDNSLKNWTSNSSNYPFHITSTGETVFTIATGLEAGNHNIAIYNQTESYMGTFGVKSITLNGELITPPAKNELYVEFVGDSITAAHGNIATGGSVNDALYEDATRGYAYLTAKELDADWSIVARSGITAIDGIGWGGSGSTSMQDIYPYQRYYSDTTTIYGFEREPDVIVLGLGTNDCWTWNNSAYGGPLTDEQKVAGFKSMLVQLRDYNPNAKIVWIYGMMTSAANDFILDAVSDMGGASCGYYTLELPKDTSGGHGHPGLAAQTIYAEAVADCISDITAEFAEGETLYSLDASQISAIPDGWGMAIPTGGASNANQVPELGYAEPKITLSGKSADSIAYLPAIKNKTGNYIFEAVVTPRTGYLGIATNLELDGYGNIIGATYLNASVNAVNPYRYARTNETGTSILKTWTADTAPTGYIAATKDVKYKLKLVCYNGTLSFYFNDVLVYSVDDSENATEDIRVGICAMWGSTWVNSVSVKAIYEYITLPDGTKVPKGDTLYDVDFSALSQADATNEMTKNWDIDVPSGAWGNSTTPSLGYSYSLPTLSGGSSDAIGYIKSVNNTTKNYVFEAVVRRRSSTIGIAANIEFDGEGNMIGATYLSAGANNSYPTKCYREDSEGDTTYKSWTADTAPEGYVAVTTGEDYKLKVVAFNGTFYFYFNDIFVYSVDDSANTTDKISVGLCSIGGSTNVKSAILYEIDETVENVVKGDANKDGSVDICDLVLIHKVVHNGLQAEINISNADFNEDGKLSAEDVTLMRKSIILDDSRIS